MEDKNLTAVEWLADKMLTEHHSKIEWYKIVEQAKAMEKEQIVEAFFQGVDRESDGHGAMYLSRKDAEQYYNETFE